MKINTYCILRQYHPGLSLKYLPLQARTRVVRKGLTLEEAQAHCNDPKTSTAYYFDSYSSEEKCTNKKGYNIKDDCFDHELLIPPHIHSTYKHRERDL